jgi:two-component system chemotaxis sensor kinase CheA
MSDGELTRLVFLPGFSTAEKVTNVSGRGVGMDVVKTNIERAGGTVDIVSHVGVGTTIKIKIPLTLAIIPALIVSLGSDRYAIPQVSLLELVRIEAAEVARRVEHIQGAPVLRLRDRLLPLVDLMAVLAEPPAQRLDDVSIVILQADDRAFGLVVDGVNDTEEIVVKPLGRELKRLATFAGATILGDGRVALILDVVGVARRAEVLSEVRDHGMLANDAASSEVRTAAGQALLLVQRGDRDRLALPLSLVSRLEEFPCGDIEEVDSRRVMQYRGEILPLVSLDGVLGSSRSSGATAAETEKVQVVVLSGAGGSVGLEIDRILDIVYDRVVVRKAGARVGVCGTAVIQGRVTEMLDVGAAMQALGVAAAS